MRELEVCTLHRGRVQRKIKSVVETLYINTSSFGIRPIPDTKAMGDGCAAPPLRVVLGAFANGFSSSASPSKLCSCEALPSATAISGESPASYILGTSYFADPQVGSSRGRMAMRLNKDGRVLMEDRKGALDHFRPKSLLLSVSNVGSIDAKVIYVW